MKADQQQRLRKRERKARLFAEHLALRVAKHDGAFTLSERYGAKKKLGEYGSLDALRRAISYRLRCMLREFAGE